MNVLIRLARYRNYSNTERIKTPNLNDSRIVLLFPFPSALKPDVEWRMKMFDNRQAMLQLHLSDQQVPRKPHHN